MARRDHDFSTKPGPASPASSRSHSRARSCAYAVGLLLGTAGSAHGAELAFCDGDRLLLFDTSTLAVEVVQHKLLNGCTHARVSPDGSKIAFVAKDLPTGYIGLFVTTRHSFNPVRVGFKTGWHREPAWSPDGRIIAFGLNQKSHWWDPAGARDPAVLMYLYLEEGRIEQRLPQGPCRYAPAFIGASGDLLITETDCTTHWNVARLNAEATTTSLLTSGVVRDHHPAPSPDGKSFVFVRYSGTSPTLTLAPMDGNGRPRVLAYVRSIMTPQPQWSPDGRYVTWLSKHRLHRVDLKSPQAKPEVLGKGDHR